MRNQILRLTFFTVSGMSLLASTSCVPGADYGNYGGSNYGNGNYGNNGYRYPDSYGGYGGYPPPPPPPDYRNDCRYGNCGYGRDNDWDRHHDDRDRDHHDRDHHDRDNKPEPPRYDPPKPPEDRVIRPSCPPDTTFDGKHCILPENKRRKGGKGTVNACPNGMYLSGDRCVNN